MNNAANPSIESNLPKQKIRIFFHSLTDGSIGHYLNKIEHLLGSLNLEKEFDVNDLLEFFHVKLYYDNNLSLPDWTDEIKEKYRTLAGEALPRLNRFLNSLSDIDLPKIAGEIYFQYRETFWKLFDNLKLFNKIGAVAVEHLLEAHPSNINCILSHKTIVAAYDSCLANFLKQYPRSTELLLAKTEQKHLYKEPKYYFPKSLALEDRQVIVAKYLEQDDPNFNYVQLIETAKDHDDLKLEPRIKLLARRKAQAMAAEIFNSNNSFPYGVEVALAENQIEPINVTSERAVLKISYSRKFLDVIYENRKTDLLYCILSLFDKQGVFETTSNPRDLNILEFLGIQSKNEYVTSVAFNQRNLTAHLQLALLSKYCQDKGFTLELLIQDYIEGISAYLGASKLKFNIPSQHTAFWEKIRSLAPQIDSILKQYEYYRRDGLIDDELVKFDSRALAFEEIGSLVNKKYQYRSEQYPYDIEQCFFSDQSLLYYIPGFETKHQNLFGLLINENINYNSFEAYQRRVIDSIIQKGYLAITTEGYVKIKDLEFLFVMKILYDKGVISYWHYHPVIRRKLDSLIADKVLRTTSKLFTEQEVDYLNYYLNRRKFTNGIDLRNKYSHGTNSDLEEEQEYDYLTLGRILLQVLMKIEKDLAIFATSEKNSVK